MYASDLSGQSLSIEAVGKVLSIAKVLVLQPLRQIYLSPLLSHFPSRRAHRIMKCNYHKEIVFLFFFFPLSDIGVCGCVTPAGMNISVNKSKVNIVLRCLLSLVEVSEHLVKSAGLSVH